MKSNRAALAIFTLVLCIPGAILNFGAAFQYAPGIDFNQFYSASRLAGTRHLYDWRQLRQLEALNGPPIPSGRLPVVSWGMKPLTWLPFHTARMVWLIASLAAILLAGITWPDVNRPLMFVALAWSKPLGFLVALGQDTPFWLLFFAIAIFLLHRARPREAGAAFALCLCKYHLGLGIPLFLAAQKRWKALAGGAAAAAVLLASCFLIEGWVWPARYLDVLLNPIFSISVQRMPNLRGLAALLPVPATAELAGALAVAALLWVASRRVAGPSLGGALAAAAGLVLGHHAYVNDCALLIPLAVLLLTHRQAPLWLKCWAGLTLTPISVQLFTGDYPLLGQVFIVGFVAAALIYFAAVKTGLAPASESAKIEIT